MADYGIEGTDGITQVFIETHDWDKSVAFFQHLGYDLEFETNHRSGQFTSKTGPSLFVAEIPADREPTVQPILGVKDAASFDTASMGAEPFEETHFGTAMTSVTDPDGRTWGLQAPLDSLPPQ